MKKTLTAETSAQKNFSWPRPNGCAASGAPLPRTSPTLSNTWLATSANECTVSAKSVGDPVTNQPNPFDAAIAVLVKIETETEEDNEPLSAYLAGAEHDPLLAGEPFQSDRTACVQFAGRDADLGAETELVA